MNFKTRTSRKVAWFMFLMPLGCLAVSSRSAAQELTEEQRRNEAAQRQLGRLLEEEKHEQRKRDYRSVLSRAERADELLAQLVSSAEAYQQHVEALQRNEDGKRLAADPVSLVAYIDVIDHPAVTTEEVKAKREAVTSIVRTLKSQGEMVEEGYRPSEEMQEEVQKYYFWANDATSRHGTQQTTLETLTAKAPPLADPASATTLDVAVRNQRTRIVAMAADAQLAGQQIAKDSTRQILVEATVLAELKETKAKAAQLIAEAQARADRLELQYEAELAELRKTIDAQHASIQIGLEDHAAQLKRQKEEAGALRHAQDVDAQLKRDTTISEADKKLLIQRCQDPKVQQKLAPFLGQGFLRPDGMIGGGRGGKYDAIKPVPISYKDLAGLGALDPTAHGCTVLYSVAADYTDTMRPRWPSVSYGGWQDSPATRNLVPDAQKLLIELGPTLVELGLLQP